MPDQDSQAQERREYIKVLEEKSLKKISASSWQSCAKATYPNFPCHNSINLDYTAEDYQINGNTIEQQSTFVINGNTQTFADAWFAYDPASKEIFRYKIGTKYFLGPCLHPKNPFTAPASVSGMGGLAQEIYFLFFSHKCSIRSSKAGAFVSA